MRLRIADRILVAIAGLLLLAICAGIVAQMFFQVDMIGYATRIFTSQSPRARVALIGLAVFLLLLGVYCLFVLFRHRGRKDKYVLQKNDSGELAISVKALENMVQKCLDQHEEIHAQHLYLESRKDGLLIRIRGGVAGGVSIPLTVEALQKQIRQYVTACSGVEIKGIRVQIEHSDKEAKDAPFAIAAPAAKPLLHEGTEKPAMAAPAEVREEEPEPAQAAPQAQEAPVPEKKPAPVIPEEDEDDDRPLHQRLFSTRPEPCIVPEPPAEPEAAPEEMNAAEEASGEASPEEKPEEAADPADPEFEESLKTFDDLITGEGKEEN